MLSLIDLEAILNCKNSKQCNDCHLYPKIICINDTEIIKTAIDALVQFEAAAKKIIRAQELFKKIDCCETCRNLRNEDFDAPCINCFDEDGAPTNYEFKEELLNEPDLEDEEMACD